MRGRYHVSYEDIRAMYIPVLRHRHSAELPCGIGPAESGRHLEADTGVEAGSQGVGVISTRRRGDAEMREERMNEKSKPESAEEAETRGMPRESWSAENVLTDKIIGAAIEVHRHLGPGLLEAVYEECLCYELSQMGLKFQRQVHLPINYKGIKFESAYKMDLVVEDSIVIEIKAIEDTAADPCGATLDLSQILEQTGWSPHQFQCANPEKRPQENRESLRRASTNTECLRFLRVRTGKRILISHPLRVFLRVSASPRRNEPAPKNEPASNGGPTDATTLPGPIHAGFHLGAGPGGQDRGRWVCGGAAPLAGFRVFPGVRGVSGLFPGR